MKRSQRYREGFRKEERGEARIKRARKSNDPFDVNLTDNQRKVLGVWLCDELQRSLDAKSANDAEVEYWWSLYEQARTRSAAPWNDAADLTSYLAAEKVDALHARIMKTVWTEPIWNVEGWGDAANKAAYVEEFHQWKAEEERLQGVVDKLVLQALVEPRGLLEISEGSQLRTTRKRINAAVQTDPTTGGLVFNQDGNVALSLDDQGQPIEQSDPNQPSAEQVVDSQDRVRTGPMYRIVPYRDSAIMPGHARDEEEIYGYAKRFWRRTDTLRMAVDQGLYDADAVNAMSATNDKETDPALQRSHMNVAPTSDGQAPKELWEILILMDLATVLGNGPNAEARKAIPDALRGERWYLVTIHQATYGLLRVQFDDMERSRFVPVILFPRADRVTEGYSFVGHKLVTIIEEHTAVRNLRADRGAMQAKAPIKRQQGALWDPIEQPWGPGAVIDVRDMREVEPMIVPDITQPLLIWEQNCERTAERVAGINDVASGQVAQESRTLGEIQMATEQSFVRMDLIVRRFQESFEDIAQIRHAIWKRTLAETPEGIDAPMSLVQNLEGRGISIDQYLPDRKVTATLLDGAYRFKPHGSVETADTNRMQQLFVGGLQALGPMMQAFPMMVPMFQTPEAARAMFRQFLRVFRIPNQQAFLGSPAKDLESTAKAQMMGLLASLGGGAPMGAPPMGGPPTGAPGMPPPGAPPMAPGPAGPQ